MINRAAKWLVPKLEQWCINRDRVILISGTEDPENVYLKRMVLFRSKYFCIYIHRFLRSDKDDHHDHPFDFLGYVVSGGYIESLLHGTPVRSVWGKDPKRQTFIVEAQESVGTRQEGSWAWRSAETRHKVTLSRHYSSEEYKDAPLTVIFRGPYRREWGFWKQTKRLGDFLYVGSLYEWQKWTDYLGVPESDSRE